MTDPMLRHEVDTYEHIHQVQRLVMKVVADLLRRACEHDQSKLRSPEAEVFAAYPTRVPYGSPEYRVRLFQMRVALEHHYRENPHHPEHYVDGIRGMSLLDLVEMLLDWWAQAGRSAEGDIRRSIEQNQDRFGYTDELKLILLNTLDELERDEEGGRRVNSHELAGEPK